MLDRATELRTDSITSLVLRRWILGGSPAQIPAAESGELRKRPPTVGPRRSAKRCLDDGTAFVVRRTPAVEFADHGELASRHDGLPRHRPADQLGSCTAGAGLRQLPPN